MNRITRIEVVRLKGGWRNYKLLIWRGNHVRVYRYHWSRMSLILACMRWGEWVQKISPELDLYTRQD